MILACLWTDRKKLLNELLEKVHKEFEEDKRKAAGARVTISIDTLEDSSGVGIHMETFKCSHMALDMIADAIIETIAHATGADWKDALEHIEVYHDITRLDKEVKIENRAD